MDKMVLVWMKCKPIHPERFCGEEKTFSTSVYNEKTLCISKTESYLIRSSLSISLEEVGSELSSINNSSPESGNVGRLWKMYSSHYVKVLPDLVTETVVQVGQLYASHEVVLAAF